jgi:hypothetical protein
MLIKKNQMNSQKTFVSHMNEIKSKGKLDIDV